MGMYTELNIGLRLKKDIPEKVSKILLYMVEKEELQGEIEDHPFFDTDRWTYMLTGRSYYFDAMPCNTFEHDRITNSWHLTSRSNFKNYDNEIDLFLDWIIPYTDTKGFIGYKMYEEDENPTLIYFINGKVVTKTVSEVSNV